LARRGRKARSSSPLPREQHPSQLPSKPRSAIRPADHPSFLQVRSDGNLESMVLQHERHKPQRRKEVSSTRSFLPSFE
ncbi:hypothetical protein BDY24DRAFT_384147, partial [Mrakia frigida]|uniref:uncharacterized protein n=1 Tax=Mrakia frigida TaxID=29902 RepID=UPI003FCC2628